MIGRKLLHYEILGHIGAGGMGEVWRARETAGSWDWSLMVQIVFPGGTTIHCFGSDPEMDVSS